MGSYVTYLVTDRWSELREDINAADGGNSHSLMLNRYMAMLAVYRHLWEENVRSPNRYLFTGEQLRLIAQARVR